MFDYSLAKNVSSPLRALRKVKRDLVHRYLGRPWLDTRPSDCFIASWPRSGNTWMRNLVFRAIYPDAPVDHAILDQSIPETDHLEFAAHLRALGNSSPRIIKTHEPFRQEFGIGRTVYIVRNGLDAVLSWYHFRKSFAATKLDFPAFLRRCESGQIRYQSWHRHVASWLEQENDNILVVRYEDMLQDTASVLTRVLAHFNLGVGDAQIQQAVAASTVQKVNGQFSDWAKSKGETFSGGLGGGTGRAAKELEEVDVAFFESIARDSLKLAGYIDELEK